jgi:hypothetical protein
VVYLAVFDSYLGLGVRHLLDTHDDIHEKPTSL